MKFLTLNSHSWMEENAQQKFETLKEQILEAQYDVICFQEVNQEMASEAVETDEYYQALPSSVADSQGSLCSRIGRRVSCSRTPLLLDLGLQPYWL